MKTMTIFDGNLQTLNWAVVALHGELALVDKVAGIIMLWTMLYADWRNNNWFMWLNSLMDQNSKTAPVCAGCSFRDNLKIINCARRRFSLRISVFLGLLAYLVCYSLNFCTKLKSKFIVTSICIETGTSKVTWSNGSH